eukprot:GHVL01043404.1.p1 GENE.GHVL01043404.1~~GHVL01043404.1.p1  ORF type:complete len:1456 (+),score=379.99 GHVL01043404.1:481-4368(+)
MRSSTDKKCMRLKPKGGAWGMFGMHLVGQNETLVITEGEYDAMAVYQSTGMVAVSLPTGAKNLPVELLPSLENFKKIILWMDADAVGRTGAEQFAVKLGLGRTVIVSGVTDTPAPKDANEALLKGMDLQALIDSAKPLPHKKILSFADMRSSVYDQIYFNKHLKGVQSSTLPGLNDLFKGFRQGELSVWTGGTGIGKTTILSQLSLDYASQGVNTLWGSFEIPNLRLIQTMLCQFSGCDLEEKNHFFEIIADRFEKLPIHFMKFYGSTCVDEVLDAMAYAYYVLDVRHVVIDNLQFMLSGQRRGVETWDLQNEAIDKFRRFATNNNVHISLVVHPRKEAEGQSLGLSSVFGSVKSTQEADNVCIVQKSDALSCIEIKKNRFSGDCGKLFYVFDKKSKNIIQVENSVPTIRNSIEIDEYNLVRPKTNLANIDFNERIDFFKKNEEPSVSSVSSKPSVSSVSSQPSDSSVLSKPTVSSKPSVSSVSSKPSVSSKSSVSSVLLNENIDKKKILTENKKIENETVKNYNKNDLCIENVNSKTSFEDLCEIVKINNFPININGLSKNDLLKEILIYNNISNIADISNIWDIHDNYESTKKITSQIDHLINNIIDYSPNENELLKVCGDIKIQKIRDFTKIRELGIKLGQTKDILIYETWIALNKKHLQKIKKMILLNNEDRIKLNVPKLISLENMMKLIDGSIENEDFGDDSLSSEYIYVNSTDILQDSLKHLQNNGNWSSLIGLDLETTGLDPLTSKIRLIQLASSDSNVTVIIDCFKIPFNNTAMNPIKNILKDETVTKIFHFGKFEIKFLLSENVTVSHPTFDTLLASRLLEAGDMDGFGSFGKLKLSQVAWRYLGVELDKRMQKSDWSNDMSDEHLIYAARDASVMIALAKVMMPKIEDLGLKRAAETEFRCQHTVAEMEYTGVLLNTTIWQDLTEELIIKLNKTREELSSSLGNINLNSPMQLIAALRSMDVRGEKGGVLTDTAEATMAKIDTQKYPIVAHIRDYRKTSKAVQSFMLKVPKHIHPKTGRIHPNFQQCGANSGRFTCDSPNLQQIPRDYKYRACFIPRIGFKFVIADFSQIELRIAAEISKDKKMIEAYQQGLDLHKLTASLVTGKPLEQINKSDRQLAKAVNFGLIYGMSPWKFKEYAATSYGVAMSTQDARKFHKAYFESYKGVAEWHSKARLLRSRCTRTLSGRRAEFIEWSFTRSLNYPVQGTSADMTKDALASMLGALREFPNSKVVMCVHDEILVETPANYADQVLKILEHEMVTAGQKYLKVVPCVAEGAAGDSWAEKP